jgi:C-terminal processing protease CtpA/Prc
MDDLSLPTLHRVHNPHTSNLDMTKTLSRESGSHDEILKYRAARRKINIADCSTTVETDQESPAEASSEGPEESMTNSVEELRRSRVSENLYLPASKVEQRDFDEESYGASLGGYNASKTVTVTKSTPVESIGISFLTDHTDWGALLIVSKISSSGLLSKTELWVGDIILAINDVNFRDNPDAEHAAAVISDARNKVCIEFQRISGWKAALPPRQTQTMEVTETLLSDGRKIVRTETFHADKTKKVKIEEFVPPRRVNVPILPNNSYSDISGLASIDVGDMRGLEAASFNDDFQRQGAKQRMLFSVENAEALDADSPKLSHRRDPGLKSLSFDTSFLRRKDVEQEPVHIVQTRIDRNADAQTIMRPRTRESKTSAAIFKATVGPKGTDTIVLTVTKKHSSQEVGISMGTVKGVLYVTKLSPSSLFVGKAILPGDTILSINNISFRKDAATKDAFAAIVNAPNTVTIELKKTGSQKYVLDTDYSDEGASKRCGIFGLLGRGKKSNRSRSLSSGPKGRDRSIRKSKQGEPATPDTSMEVEDFDPFYV